MNYIFGSGIVGLLAKKILGPNWKIIPFNRSRFYSFNPALDDNFIIRDEKIDAFIKDINRKTDYLLYKRAYSMQGQLKFDYSEEYVKLYLYKLFDNNYPSQSLLYSKDRLSFFVYDLRVNILYDQLQAEYNEELMSEAAKGEVKQLGDNFFIRNGVKYEFDNVVNTIPLDQLLNLMGRDIGLRAKDIQYLHVASDEIDFEKCNQLLVCDDNIDFFKVTNISPNRYLFYCHKDIMHPGIYLMSFLKNFDIVDGTSIRNALPCGERPNLDKLEEKGILCVGKHAQWDWCMDLANCILRLMKYSQRGFKKNIINLDLEKR